MQRVAINWLVYKLTSSAFLLGVVNFASYIPILLISPLAGVLVDRYPKIRILITSQVLAMLQALLLAFLVFSGKVEIWHIILLSLFLGIVHAFDVPGRQSSYINLIDNKDDLPNAIALNSATFHLSRFVGPSLAGIIIAAFGEAVCFLVNGLSYVPVIISLFMLNMPPEEKPLGSKVLDELKDGFSYISQTRALKIYFFLLQP
jgi:MFS family permease